MEREMVKKVKEIEMPKEMQERILKNCYKKAEENSMNKNRTKLSFGKMMAVAASLVLCLCVTSVTALAVTGKLEGFFKDITRWDGAIIGTSYEQATDEVEINIIDASDEFTVEVKLLKPENPPYISFEMLGVAKYEIVDEDGRVMREGNASEMVRIEGGKAYVKLPLETDTKGEYKLKITELIGSSKADQPLLVNGTWECIFNR